MILLVYEVALEPGAETALTAAVEERCPPPARQVEGLVAKAALRGNRWRSSCPKTAGISLAAILALAVLVSLCFRELTVRRLPSIPGQRKLSQQSRRSCIIYAGVADAGSKGSNGPRRGRERGRNHASWTSGHQQLSGIENTSPLSAEEPEYSSSRDVHNTDAARIGSRQSSLQLRASVIKYAPKLQIATQICEGPECRSSAPAAPKQAPEPVNEFPISSTSSSNVVTFSLDTKDGNNGKRKQSSAEGTVSESHPSSTPPRKCRKKSKHLQSVEVSGGDAPASASREAEAEAEAAAAAAKAYSLQLEYQNTALRKNEVVEQKVDMANMAVKVLKGVIGRVRALRALLDYAAINSLPPLQALVDLVYFLYDFLHELHAEARVLLTQFMHSCAPLSVDAQIAVLGSTADVLNERRNEKLREYFGYLVDRPFTQVLPGLKPSSHARTQVRRGVHRPVLTAILQAYLVVRNHVALFELTANFSLQSEGELGLAHSTDLGAFTSPLAATTGATVNERSTSTSGSRPFAHGGVWGARNTGILQPSLSTDLNNARRNRKQAQTALRTIQKLIKGANGDDAVLLPALLEVEMILAFVLDITRASDLRHNNQRTANQSSASSGRDNAEASAHNTPHPDSSFANGRSTSVRPDAAAGVSQADVEEDRAGRNSSAQVLAASTAIVVYFLRRGQYRLTHALHHFGNFVAALRRREPLSERQRHVRDQSVSEVANSVMQLRQHVDLAQQLLTQPISGPERYHILNALANIYLLLRALPQLDLLD